MKPYLSYNKFNYNSQKFREIHKTSAYFTNHCLMNEKYSKSFITRLAPSFQLIEKDMTSMALE